MSLHRAALAVADPGPRRKRRRLIAGAAGPGGAPLRCRSPRRKRRRLIAGAALAAILAAAAAGCGSSADPDTWAEAEDGDHGDYNSAVEENFKVSCLLANDSSTGGNLNAAEARVLCGCAFDGLRSNLTLQEFKALDKALRETPNPSDLDEEPEDVWDDRAEEILASCARRVDA